MHDLFRRNGERVKLDHVVSRIVSNKDSVSVYCKNGKMYRGKYVIVALAPTLYRSIDFEPQLSWERNSISQRMPMGYIIKTNTFWKTPFWRELGYNGLTVHYYDDDYKGFIGPIATSFDDCKPDGSCYSLMGFILSNQMTQYQELTKLERQELVLKQYYNIFNKDDRVFNEFIGYFEMEWNKEKYSQGCYVGSFNCNVMSQEYYKILRKPKDNKIYFSGTELATKWQGYMDGAIQSGEMTANKIANILLNKNIPFIADESEPNDCELKAKPFQSLWIEDYLPSKTQFERILIMMFIFVLGCGFAFVFR